MKRIRAKKGFTLVETLIAMTVFLILAGMTMSVVLVGTNIYTKNAKRNAAQRTGNDVIEIIGNHLTYALDVRLSSAAYSIDNVKPSESVSYIHIPMNGNRVDYGVTANKFTQAVKEENLNGMRLVVRLSIADRLSHIIRIDVQVIDINSDEILYSSDEAVLMMNIDDENMPSADISNLNSDLYIGVKELG